VIDVVPRARSRFGRFIADRPRARADCALTARGQAGVIGEAAAERHGGRYDAERRNEGNAFALSLSIRGPESR
jgi:hypothetical protein